MRNKKGIMAEGKGLAKVFSGFAQNMCRAVT
ncbi:hypothetical protein CFSAN002367_13462 [Clostridium botulinum CFSAN002367]|nr:hypothetical protein CFSAN002369_19401 [Clostridium botulinum CFSAN002369]EPS48305.1 hypothetical protein CFSAN002368_21656 [Clostridium botulinum A1 str. CFSAN002368]EPS50059.1 hypothetical protein CFSAN002367_13462 [Clostridium botulinum CFSAN002367]